MHALILGASPNALSVARSLGRFGLEIAVMEGLSNYNKAISASRYVHRFIELNDPSEDAIVTRLMSLGNQDRRVFLFATGDRYALLVAKYQNTLKAQYAFVCSTYSILEAIIDKAKLYTFAQDIDVPCPAFYVVSEEADIDSAVVSVPTPCYVKPAKGHLWREFKSTKIERAETPEQLRDILQSFVSLGLVAIPQEIIPGNDSDVVSLSAYISSSGQCIGWRTKRKLHQWPLNAGDGALQEICHQDEVAETGLRLLSALGHRGAATVEFRLDERSGRLALIEINARTILAQEMITRSGLNVPLLAYHDAMKLPIPEPGPVAPVRWIYFGNDFRAFREMRRAGSITLWEWLRVIVSCNAFAYFAVDDPFPFLVRLRTWITRQTKLI